jgi:hypothetical protein
MTTLIVLALLLALYVFAVGWILGVPLRRPRIAHHKTVPKPKKAPARLLLAVLLFAAGAAILLLIAINWIASFLHHTLS